MKIVIDIPEAKLKALQIGEKQGVGMGMLERAVLDGTPLPKGYGRLIDANAASEIMRDFMCGTGYQDRAMWVLGSQMCTPTIIEADEEEKK